jgi:hypothetical protein
LILLLASHLLSGLRTGHFPWDFRTKTLYEFPVSPSYLRAILLVVKCYGEGPLRDLVLDWTTVLKQTFRWDLDGTELDNAQWRVFVMKAMIHNREVI